MENLIQKHNSDFCTNLVQMQSFLNQETYPELRLA